MTPLVYGRRALRRLPRGGVHGRRVSVWDAMGYHGIAWASNDGPLTGCTLKEWLRWTQLADGSPAAMGQAWRSAKRGRTRAGVAQCARLTRRPSTTSLTSPSRDACRVMRLLKSWMVKGRKIFTNPKLKTRADQSLHWLMIECAAARNSTANVQPQFQISRNTHRAGELFPSKGGFAFLD